MKVYMFFANHIEVIEGILNFYLFPREVSDTVHGELYSLYAFTTKKKYRDSFFKLRKKKYFIATEREMDESEYEQFHNMNAMLELNKYTYENISTKITFITTLYEYDESKHLWIDIFSEHPEDLFGFLPYILTDTLKEKYKNAIFAIGLNALLLVADDELSNMIDNLDYSLDEDYVLNIPLDQCTKVLGRKVIAPISIKGKTLNSFIHIFKDILNENIREV